jgi:uncharacterized circularly permuted ATP-grasp superfamily protein
VAPPTSSQPRIVVLSPGPRSETAFEHAVLSSTLGYSLVDGLDLTARRNRIWVRSLGRLEQVDVILRRVDAWCGDPAGCSHVVANLRQLVVKPIAREAGSYQVLGWEKSASELDDLRRQIDARPHWWVGQQQLGLASTPTLTDRGLEARRCVVRTFAVRRGDSYLAMPGGLARVPDD